MSAQRPCGDHGLTPLTPELFDALLDRGGASLLNNAACKGVYKIFPVLEKLDAASS